MKRMLAVLILVIPLITISLKANANPVDKGRTRVGASSAFSYNNFSSGNGSSDLDLVLFSADVDYFVADHFSVGPNFNLAHASVSGLDTTLFIFGASAGLWRWIGDRFIPYVQVAPGLSVV